MSIQNQNSTNQSTNLLGQKDKIDLKELIKKPRHKERILKAIELEKRVRLHTVGTQDSTTFYDDWLVKVKNYIDPAKFDIFKELVGSPVPTLSLTETIFDELAKIFESSNPSQKFSFKNNDELKGEQFTDYFNHNQFFRTEYYNQLKTSPNSFVIVDTKLELTDNGQQQPITYFVDISNVLDVECDRDGNVNYILFYADNKKDRIVGIDNEYYYVYIKSESDWVDAQGFPSKHDIKDSQDRPMTPAFMLYPHFLNASDNIIVNSPLTKSIGDLEWLLFWAVSKRHLDSYASFPIYATFEEDCTYTHPTGEKCDGGYVKISTGDISDEHYTVIECPKCSANKMLGAGTTITVRAPQEQGEPNNLDAVRVIPADKNSVDYVTTEKVRLEQEVYYGVLGKTSEPIESFSQSAQQLDLTTESRKAVLIRTKSIVEKVHQKVVYTMCKLMYGDDFIDFYINYGDNYFLTTPEQETKKYSDLKNSGAPESMLHASLSRLIATTYKTSPSTALLQEVYLEVEPHQTKSVEQVQKLYGMGLVTRKDVVAKIYFTDFIEQFEAQNKALVSAITITKSRTKEVVVKQIKQLLDTYVTTIIEQLDGDYEDKMEKMEEENEMKQESSDLPKPSSVEKRKYREGEQEEDED